MRLHYRFSLVLLCVASLGAQVADSAKPSGAASKTNRFEISKQTTYFSGPVRPDGTIDYLAAINEPLSNGVTTTNNAATPLLRAVRMFVPDEQQAHYARLWKALGEAEPPIEQGVRINDVGNVLDNTPNAPWTAARHARAAALLDSMKPELDLLVDASRRNHFYMPLVREHNDDSLVSVMLPHLSTFRYLAFSLKCRAMLCLGNEDIAGFRRDALALVRLGRLATHASILVEALVAMSVEDLGLDAIMVGASGGWLPEKDAEGLLSDMRLMPARRRVTSAFDGLGRGFMLEFLQIAAVHGYAKAQQTLKMAGGNNPMSAPSLANNAHKDWNAAMRKANAWFDRLAEAGMKPTYGERIKAAREIVRDVEELNSQIDGWKSTLAPIEDRLIVLLLPSVEGIFTIEARTAAKEELAQTTLALSAFRTKLGEYPPQLKLLAPAYFKTEPLDPFTDKPLIYKTVGNGYELKSAGPPNQQAQNQNTAITIEATN